MNDDRINQAFDSLQVPAFNRDKFQQTLAQASATYQDTAVISTKDSVKIEENENESLWQKLYDFMFAHGAMVAVSMLALTVGISMFIRTPETVKFAVQEQDASELKSSVELIDQSSELLVGRSAEAQVQELGRWIESAETSKTYTSRTIPTKAKRALQKKPAQPGVVDQIESLNQQGLEIGLPAEALNNNFQHVDSNPIKQVRIDPVSAFSIDTDTASYSFIRRQLNSGYLPVADAVRVEEMINYFDYDYPVDSIRRQPFSVATQVMPSPWNKHNKLLHIGIKAFELAEQTKRVSNLVFLIDTSGSMQSQDKLPLLINSFKLLLNQLNDDDHIAIVTYAGQAGVALEPTMVKDKAKILAVLDNLSAAGSTAGHAGIKQAYQLAQQNFNSSAVNRIFLATDGDFNVGIDQPDELESYIAKQRDSGVFLTVLGFGDGNYNDHIMQSLAQNGNGQAFYIDTFNESRKVLLEQAASTLFAVAKDVKIQIEFNPSKIAEYRLIGYESRLLKAEDFNNDKVDAAEVGAGHAVTAIYEMTPMESPAKAIDDSRYQQAGNQKPSGSVFDNEYAYLKIRYKLPDQSHSQKISSAITTEHEVSDLTEITSDAGFAVAVAGFGQLLKNSKYIDNYSFKDVLDLAVKNIGADRHGYRQEFIQLVKIAEALE